MNYFNLILDNDTGTVSPAVEYYNPIFVYGLHPIRTYVNYARRINLDQHYLAINRAEINFSAKFYGFRQEHD